MITPNISANVLSHDLLVSPWEYWEHPTVRSPCLNDFTPDSSPVVHISLMFDDQFDV